MLVKRNAISSLMLELDSDDLPQSDREKLLNLLALEIVDFVTTPQWASNLLDYEKRVIKCRGTNPDVYLMNDNLNTKEVLKRYYSSIYYDNHNCRNMIPNLSISELMLMLGVFEIMKDRRIKIRKTYEKRLKQVNKKTSKRFGYYLRKRNGIDELVVKVYREEILNDRIDEENSFIDILAEHTNLLNKKIFSAFGLTGEFVSPENSFKIARHSKELALSYYRIREDSNVRKKVKASLLDDVLFLEFAGDLPENYEQIFKPDRDQHEFAKLLKNES